MSTNPYPFTLRFFGGFKRQRTAFLEAKEIAPCKVHPAVQARLDELITSLLGRNPPAEHSGNIWRSSIRAVRPLLILSVISNIGSAACVLLAVLGTKAVLDHADNLALALGLATLFFAAEVVDNWLQYFESQRRAQIERGIQLHLFARINRKLLELDPSVRGELSKGNLKTLVSSDIESIEDFITAASANWIPTIVLCVTLTPTIYLMSGVIGLVGLGVAVLQIPVSIFLAKFIERYQDKAQTQQDKLTTLVGEWVKNIRLVRYLGWQPEIEKEIRGQVRQLTVDSLLRHALLILTFGISFSWWMAPIVVMLIAAPALGISLELSSFFSSIWALSYLTNYLQHIPHSISMYGSAAAGAKRMQTLLAAPELRRFLSKSTLPATPSGNPNAVICSGVTVVVDGANILSLPALTINLAQKTAIVGLVGSGKSVLLELITGERAPTKGTIEIQFAGAARYSLWDETIYHHFREFIAFSPQQPFLSNTTLQKNIDLGDDLDIHAVEGASEQAQLTSDIGLFPRGYEEEVGETGINLSGGQKQRVSLARAFASHRPIFVLDDPLSAVDRTTEQRLAKRIFEAAGGLILVSHRLDELQACDRILVLEDGAIAEEGTPNELIAVPGSAFNRFLQAAAAKHEEAA